MAHKVESVRLDRLTKRFRDTLALDGFSMEIRGEEFVTLLGPSGCGKSTALNCIAGLLPLDEGGIYVDGRPVHHLPPHRRDLGMVFQNYALFPHLTVRRNVAFGLEVRAVERSEINRRVNQVLELTRLQTLADRYPAQLSGGQQQRVALARGFVVEPSILLLDEPLSNLDTALRTVLRTEIKKLHRSLGLTSIYVTHDQGEALSLSDRIVVMSGGMVQQIGTPEEVFRRPVNRFVATFMGFTNQIRMRADAVTSMAVVTQGSLQLVAGQHRDVQPGQEVEVVIRPESFQIGDTGNGRNRMAGTVELVEYLGTETHAEVRLTSSHVVQVRTMERLKEGDRLTLSVKPDEVIAFQAEAAS